MEHKTWSFIDKSKWGPGKWQTEPDKEQWLDEDTKLPCLIVRNPVGCLCGYVGVYKSHPKFGVDYGELDYIDVHGGLTFSSPCSPNEKEHGICHIVESGEDENVWWFGFDCAHSGDSHPVYTNYGVYRNIEYVKSEVRSLARQLGGLQ